MDKEQKKRITSNITFLKERLGYLDPILERLVEKNVISVEQRDRVEKVNPPTPHRKFNEFIQLLLNSHEPHAFNIFIEVLEDERFFNIVEKLQKDISTRTVRAKSSYTREEGMGISNVSVQSRPPTSHSTPQARRQPPFNRAKTQVNPGTVDFESEEHIIMSPMGDYGAAGCFDSYCTSPNIPEKAGSASYADKVTSAIGTMFAEFSGKLTNDLLDGFDRRRHEEKVDLEIRMEKKIDSTIDQKLDEKLRNFQSGWEKEKNDMIERNESALNQLQETIDNMRAQSEAYMELKQKYDQLQQTHSQMRDKENERWQRLTAINKENTGLKNEGEVLRTELMMVRERVDDLEADNRALKDNEVQDQHRINQLLAEKEDIILELERAEREKIDLRNRVDSMAREIEKLMYQQNERALKDDRAYQEALKKQNERLDELYKVVQTLTERERQSKSLFIGGNSLGKAQRQSAQLSRQIR